MQHRWFSTGAIAALMVGGLACTAQTANVQQADRLFRDGSAAFAAENYSVAHADFAKLVHLVPQVAAGHTAFGAVLLAEGQNEAAVRELELARKLDPKDVPTALNLGVAYRRLDRNTDAVRSFSKAADQPGVALSATEAVSYAGALAATQEAGRAQTVIEEALAREPQNAVLVDALGALQAQRGDLGGAQESFRRAIALEPNLPSAHLHLGSLLMILPAGQANPAEAVAEFRNAQKLGDGSLTLLLGLGKALTASGKDAEAVEVLRKAVAAAPGSSPSSWDAKYSLALALQNQGNPKEALPLFREVTAQQPQNTGALTNYGLALMQTGDAKGALQLYNQAHDAGDASATLREDMGGAYLQQNDIDHAIEQFRAGLAVNPQDVQLHYDLGLAYKLKDDLDASVSELKYAEQLDPQLPDPYYTLGVIEMQRGDFPQAKAQLEQAVALQPANGEAWSVLGSVDKQSGDDAGAEAALRHAIELLPQQPSNHVTLASILSSRGDTAGAAAERKVAADLSRAVVSKQRAQFALDSGKAYLARGQVNEAIIQLQTAVAAQPELVEAHVALADAFTRAGRNAEALSERQKVETIKAAKP